MSHHAGVKPAIAPATTTTATTAIVALITSTSLTRACAWEPNGRDARHEHNCGLEQTVQLHKVHAKHACCANWPEGYEHVALASQHRVLFKSIG